MSGDDGLRDEMHRFFARRPDRLALDEDTAARLLSGRLDPTDAPPGFAGVARVIGAAAAPARPEELAGEDDALATYRAVSRPAQPPATHTRGWRLAALVTAGLLLLGGVAGAVSTGALPDAAQSVAHDALGAVGVSVPTPPRPATRVRAPARRPAPPTAASRPTAQARPVPRAPAAPPRPPAPSPSTASRARPSADSRLVAACRAYQHGRVSPTGGKAAANAYRYLTSRAGDAAQIAGFCQRIVGGAAP